MNSLSQIMMKHSLFANQHLHVSHVKHYQTELSELTA